MGEEAMVLDFSQNTIFPSHSLEQDFFSAIKLGNQGLMEDSPNNSLDGFCGRRNFNLETENNLGYRRERSEEVSDDVLDLLPADPFGMDLSTTFTVITEWLEDIEKDLASLGFICDGVEMKADEERVFTGLNLVWNGLVKFCPEGKKTKISETSTEFDEGLERGLYDGDLVMGGNIEELMCLGYEKYWVTSDAANNDSEGCSSLCCGADYDGDAPHDALFFALGYLGVRDLLSIGRVCRSFRDAVRNDPLLWRSIHIDWPLNNRLTDDRLLWLTSRAQGTLQCLSLVECSRITAGGLRHVLESNPGLTKLSIPGCGRLSVESILCSLKDFKSSGSPGIKHLRIGGLYGVTQEQFEELNFLLGMDYKNQRTSHKPRFYGAGRLYLSCDDDRAIDIEACPKCQKLRQVYDCPAESCLVQHPSAQICRACTFCIARCISCGRCINDNDYEETFCLDLLCLDCWKQLLNCHERQEEMDVHSSKCTIFHQQASFHFCLHE